MEDKTVEIKINGETFVNIRTIHSEFLQMLERNDKLPECIEIPCIPQKWMNALEQTKEFLKQIEKGKKYHDIFVRKNPNYSMFMILKAIENYLLLDEYFSKHFQENWKYKLFISNLNGNKELSEFFNKRNKK